MTKRQTPPPELIAAARLAQHQMEYAAAEYERATKHRRAVFLKVLASGATQRSLAEEVGLSPAAIEKVAGKDRPA
jgi:ribosomal protein L15